MKKVILALITGLLIISVNLYAQEEGAGVDSQQAAPDTANSPETAASDNTDSSKDPVVPDSALSATAGESDGSAAASTGALMSVQIFPGGNSGAAVTSIPIEVPPGRKGIQPNISLN